MIAINMEMPKECYRCPLLDGEYGTCNIIGETKVDMTEERASGCPLVEIVACKDCKYYRNKGNKYSYCTKRLNVDSITDRYREPNYYCSEAERGNNYASKLYTM